MVTRCRYDLPDDEVIYLTRLQVSILVRIVAGDSNMEIARRLGYAESSIKNVVAEILQELDVRTRLAAAMLALCHGMAPFPLIDSAQHPHTIEAGPIRRYAISRRSARRPRM